MDTPALITEDAPPAFSPGAWLYNENLALWLHWFDDEWAGEDLGNDFRAFGYTHWLPGSATRPTCVPAASGAVLV